LNHFLLVALGGASGAMLRYSMFLLFGANHLFPWATLGINIAGSFAIGLVWGMFGQADWFHQWGRLLIVIGILGGFTTFSAFSIEVLTLMQNNRLIAALAYIFASIATCLVAVWLGQKLGLTTLSY